MFVELSAIGSVIEYSCPLVYLPTDNDIDRISRLENVLNCGDIIKLHYYDTNRPRQKEKESRESHSRRTNNIHFYYYNNFFKVESIAYHLK